MSFIGAGVVVGVAALPKYERIKPVAGVIGIAVNVFPWFWLPFTSQPRPSGGISLVLSAAGILLLVFGLGLFAQGYRVIRKQIGWGHADSTAIVKEGPYRLVRNPIYLGLATAALGWALAWGGVYAILLMPLFFMILGIGARTEEKQLLRRFGEDYASYRREVPAFFPLFIAIPFFIIVLLVSLGVILGWIPLA